MPIAREPDLLHVTNGDATGEPLGRSGVPGAIAVWADALHEGPVLADVDSAEWRDVRARFFERAGVLPASDALEFYARWNAPLESPRSRDEIVIWLEHDLFDQLLLLRHVEWFARRELGSTTLSLICINRFPGVVPFHGLGQLGPEQLASLFPTRRAISVEQMELGRRAWSAFTAADPLALQQLLARDTSVLPFLQGAVRRLLEEYPDVRTGLPRTERQVLEGLAGDARTGADLFSAVQRMEDRVFMGDTTFWARLRGLARGPRPLVHIDEAEPGVDDDLRHATIEVTDTGRAVLSGEQDWVALAGMDKWIGGVHLTGHRVPWRWDSAAGEIVGVA